MVEHTTGIICAAMRGADLDRLQLPLMVPAPDNEEALCTAFTVTVDAREGTTTGVSASDRCQTLHTLADPFSVPHSLRRPGHIFPLRLALFGSTLIFQSQKSSAEKLHAHFIANVWLARLLYLMCSILSGLHLAGCYMV